MVLKGNFGLLKINIYLNNGEGYPCAEQTKGANCLKPTVLLTPVISLSLTFGATPVKGSKWRTKGLLYDFLLINLFITKTCLKWGKILQINISAVNTLNEYIQRVASNESQITVHILLIIITTKIANIMSCLY